MRPPKTLQFLRSSPPAWKSAAPNSVRFNSNSSSSPQARRLWELERAKTFEYPRLLQQSSDHAVMRIPDFRAKYDPMITEPGTVAEEKVILRGRVESIRLSGSKLAFIDLRSEFEHVQALLNLGKLVDGTDKDGFKNFARLLTRGDIISVQGNPTRTATNALSVLATSLPSVLAPSLVPQPRSIQETIHRHKAMLATPKVVDTLRLRSAVIKYLRDFLTSRSFLEVQTPILAENAGGAVARSFTVHAESVSKDVSLRIAPELWLKRLVVGGIERVFELGPAFRNEGIDQTHNPEFTICEFYHAYANLSDLISLTESLVRGLASHCQSVISSQNLNLPPIDLSVYEQPFQQAEFIPSLESALGFALPDLSSPSALEDLVSLLQTHHPDVVVERGDLDLPHLLDRLAAIFIEPLSETKPLFITHQPVCMSPLSKSFLCPKTKQLVSARTELFMGGKELANMYEEENDPRAQRQKFVEQLKMNGKDDKEVDDSYVYALMSGLPPTGGWGCGVERLVMLFSGTAKISEVLSFGNLRNVIAGGGSVSVEGKIPGEWKGEDGER
ncbi:hypothetical protein QBC35DRAFT_374891 [Podospora australis]|uniref:Lysyl-tRNA synthetase n=1 Tax=Podospora australis TaxID=1536484 RepID=A0AAN7ALT4_9PEZI|nr:hypothetical protein QBC35DRAFT_374891 [Podospora australis]